MNHTLSDLPYKTCTTFPMTDSTGVFERIMTKTFLEEECISQGIWLWHWLWVVCCEGYLYFFACAGLLCTCVSCVIVHRVYLLVVYLLACAGLLCTRGKQLKVCGLSMPEARKCDKAGKAYLGKITLRKCESARRKNDNCTCAPKHMASCNQLKVRLPWYSLCTKPDDIKSLLSSFQFESLDFFPFWMLYSIWTYRV